MAYTTQQLADLRAAIAEGVLRVSANGRSTEFRSQEDMLRLEQIMAAELEPAQFAAQPRRILASFRRA